MDGERKRDQQRKATAQDGKSHTVASCRFLRRRQLRCLVLSAGRRIVLSWRLLDNPARAGVPLTEDLEPGPHQSLAGLAWKVAHAAATCSWDGSASDSSQAQLPRPSLTLRAPSCFLARSSVVIEIPSS